MADKDKKGSQTSSKWWVWLMAGVGGFLVVVLIMWMVAHKKKAAITSGAPSDGVTM